MRQGKIWGIFAILTLGIIPLLAGGCSDEVDNPSDASSFTVFEGSSKTFGSDSNWGLYMSDSKLYFSSRSEDLEDIRMYRYLSLGKRNSLSDIKSIPETGWTEDPDNTSAEWHTCKIDNSLEPGDCFILEAFADEELRYAKIRIADYAYKTLLDKENGVWNGVKIDAVAPFTTPIHVKDAKKKVPGTGGEVTFELKNPAPVKVLSLPEWIKVMQFQGTKLTFVAAPNVGNSNRKGEIKIGNDKNSVTLTVEQKPVDEENFAGGDGSKENPYLVSSATQLDRVRLYPDKHFKQTADIDLAELIKNYGGSWNPINNFSGSFDGAMHTISGLEILYEASDSSNSNNPSYAGLFSTAENAEFSNMQILLGSNGINGMTHAAGICGLAVNSTFTGCSVVGETIYAYSHGDALHGPWGDAAGIANTNNEGLVQECQVIVDNITGGSCNGTAYCTNINCIFVGNIKLHANASGSVNVFGKDARNCYCIGEYTGETYYWASDRENLNEYGELAKSFVSCYSTLTTPEADLKKKATFVGWDFQNVWAIDEGVSYPRLRCFENR